MSIETAFLTKPVYWLLGVVFTLLGIVWKDNKAKVKENTDNVNELREDLLKEYYSKKETDERIAFAINPVRDAMIANTEAVKELTGSIRQMHTDLEVLKERSNDSRRD